MKKSVIALVIAAFSCASCAATVGHHGASVAIAPPLPVFVELAEPNYIYRGYHYYHHDDRWYYVHPMIGRLMDLPRDRYPKEVRFKYKGGKSAWKDDRSNGHWKGFESR